MPTNNTLGVWNPTFFAGEALSQLHNAMGMSKHVHRGFEKERNKRSIGEVISIGRPSTFTAQNAPSTAQDITTDTVNITLDKWKEVKFTLTDKELSFTQDQIIQDHIIPASYALANDLDQSLCQLYKNVPHRYKVASATKATVADLTGTRNLLFKNKVPLLNPANIHLMVDGDIENEFLQLQAFSNFQGAGTGGVNTQVTGNLGQKYGMNLFANQNVPAHVAGTFNETTGTVNGVTAKGATTIVLDGVITTGKTVKAGDILNISGDPQPYVITADATSTTNAMTLQIAVPGRGGLQQAAADTTAVTIDAASSIGEGLAFHRNAFALAMAPLSETGNNLGARIRTITDPTSNLSVRARMYYEGNASAVTVALDILYGYQTLDANQAARFTNID